MKKKSGICPNCQARKSKPSISQPEPEPEPRPEPEPKPFGSESVKHFVNLESSDPIGPGEADFEENSSLPPQDERSSECSLNTPKSLSTVETTQYEDVASVRVDRINKEVCSYD